MLCSTGGDHATYQDTIVSNLLTFYPDPFTLPKASWKTIIDFWHLDLSETNVLLKNYYSDRGPYARIPSSMLRSYLLSLKIKISSITDWVVKLHECPLYAILSGFPVDDIPGVGTFYDFFNRLWLSDTNNLSPHERYKKKKVKKGEKTGDKTPIINKNSCAKLLPFLVRNPLKPNNPFSLIFQLYKQQFLDVSIDKGLINTENLSVAGDGTPIRTSARGRSKRLCKCREQGIFQCDCKRHFSQPDCNSGWDSSRECYFSGYHLYMFVASNSFSDLPIFPLLERGSRHDMLSFLHSFFTMKAYLPEFKIESLLLDAAHDAYPLFDYCKKENIDTFIDLNPGNTGNFIYKEMEIIDGIPHCQMGLPMAPNGYEKSKHRFKFRCPLFKKGDCSCKNPCSNAKYGRTFHITCKDNPRLFTEPARGSKEYEAIYDRRTSVERSNKREKIDYKYEEGHHRSSEMWYCRLYAIMMLQHQDAWEKPSVDSFKETFLNI